jgi:hypothetical protein
LRKSQTPEIESLAAAEDGRRDLVRFGSRKNENDMRRRLLERLEQRVESLGCQHVDFINYIYFETPLRRPVPDCFPQFPDAVDPPVGCTVYFDNIDRVALCCLTAVRTFIAGSGRGALFAIEGFCQDAGDGGFADPSRPSEKIGVGDATQADCVLERPGNVRLADDFFESLRAPLSGNHEIGHKGIG